MNEQQTGYLRKMLTERQGMLPRLISVEAGLSRSSAPDWTQEARETAARRAGEYREELTLVGTIIEALDHPEPEHHQFCMRHGHAHPDTGDPSCQWQPGT